MESLYVNQVNQVNQVKKVRTKHHWRLTTKAKAAYTTIGEIGFLLLLFTTFYFVIGIFG